MFLFLKYVQPTWYYNLLHRTKVSLLIDTEELVSLSGKQLSPVLNYETEKAKLSDLAFQALHKGLIPSIGASRPDLQDVFVVSLYDNYRFIRRYFGNLKALYVLFIRLLCLHNPFLEIFAFFKTTDQKKVDLFANHESYDDFLSFESILLKENPLISIVIPTLNRYPYLKDVLSDLEKQTYKNFEVLICDQSDSIDQNFYSNWKFNFSLFVQEQPALWLARNTCIQNSKGSFIALTEDDVRLPSDWLENHLKCIDYFGVKVSCGIFYPKGQKPTLSQSFFRLSDIFATGNTLINKTVFKITGLFDCQFEGQRMGDGEFGLRCLLNDEKLILNPFSYCIDLKASSGGLRQMGSWDSLRSNKFLAPRPMPSVLYYIRRYFGNSNAVFYIIQNIPFSYIPYELKNSRQLKYISIILIPFIFPLLLYVSCKSWILASKMLRQGSQIPILP